MITENTVFVLGAGSSAAYRFPTGDALLAHLRGGVPLISVPDDDDDWPTPEEDPPESKFKKALKKAECGSIDEFLKNFPEHAEIGKKCVARALIPYEVDPVVCNAKWNDDWLRVLWDRMKEHPRRFAGNRVSFITYNYDRLIEHFFVETLKKSFSGVTYPEAWSHFGPAIEVIHVHGQLGTYSAPEIPNSKGRRYGDVQGDDVEGQCARSIRLFWENAPDHVDIRSRMRGALTHAKRIVFLGFGFLESNMEHLSPLLDGLGPRPDIWGTCLGLTQVRQERLRRGIFSRTPKQLIETNCSGLLNQIDLY